MTTHRVETDGTRHLRAAEPLPDDQRIGLARSILAHAEGHEHRAITEALAVLAGAGIEQLQHERDTTSTDWTKSDMERDDMGTTASGPGRCANTCAPGPDPTARAYREGASMKPSQVLSTSAIGPVV